MKKSKALAAAMLSVSLTGMISGCEEAPWKNVPQNVYGPPPANEEITGEYDLPEPLYGPPIAEEESIEEEADAQEQTDNALPE